MNSAKKAKKTSDTIYPVIIGNDGNKYVDPLQSDGKYLVRKYDVPELDDLEAFRSMLKDFEQRFLRNVSRGDFVAATSPEKLNHYIDKEREALKVIQMANAGPEKDEKLQAQEDVTKRWLATALLARAMRLSKYHIKLRKAGTQDPAELDPIKESIIKDTLEVMSLDPDLRNKRGHADSDGIIAEMPGEPRNIFVASTADSKDLMKLFYDNRYLKVAESMRSIDKAVAAVARITARHPELRTSLREMGETAKHKIQILHNDSDYPAIDLAYIAARDKTHGLIGEAMKEAVSKSGQAVGHIGRMKAKKYESLASDMTLIKQAADLIYDSALTRNGRDNGVAELKLAVKAAESQIVGKH